MKSWLMNGKGWELCVAHTDMLHSNINTSECHQVKLQVLSLRFYGVHHQRCPIGSVPWLNELHFHASNLDTCDHHLWQSLLIINKGFTCWPSKNGSCLARRLALYYYFDAFTILVWQITSLPKDLQFAWGCIDPFPTPALLQCAVLQVYDGGNTRGPEFQWYSWVLFIDWICKSWRISCLDWRVCSMERFFYWLLLSYSHLLSVDVAWNQGFG